MALKISGTTVIDNSRAITNVTSYSGPGIASQSEAEAGTNNDQLMTPLRVKQAIDEAMAGLSYPDISTDGWPGTDKGHEGFGAFMTKGTDFTTSIMPYGEVHDPNRLQDLVTRNSPSWESNRTANKSTTELTPITGSIGWNSGDRNTIYIRFPNPIGSKTLDIYLKARSNSYSTPNANDEASDDLTLRWVSGIANSIPSNGYTNATFARSRVYDGNYYRAGATYRYRVTSAPESTVLNIAGSGIVPDYNVIYLHLCYYEVY